MSRASVLARGRAFAVGGFVDTCTITRITNKATDILTGQVAKQTEIVYAGVCRVQQAAAPWAGPSTVGEAAIRIAALELQLPVATSVGIEPDDKVTINTCTHDVELVGREFFIAGEHHATHKTTRRLPLQEILS